MGLSREEMFNEIVLSLVRSFLGHHTLDSLTSTGLHSILASRCSLDIATITQSHDHAVIRNQILNGYLSFVGKNRAATRGRIFFLNFEQLIFNNGKHSLFTSKNIKKVFDLLNNSIVFRLDLVLLHRGQLIKP